jgi:predicted transcriptional regulator
VPDATDVIISIHPAHAEAILAGIKTIELRRRVPNLPSGTKLWIYATRPTAAIVGVATIADVARAHPKTIWKRHRNGAAVDHNSFKEYFNGSHQAVAIVLAAVTKVGPVTIDQLRVIRGHFHPPQVLTVLTANEARALKKLAKR